MKNLLPLAVAAAALVGEAAFGDTNSPAVLPLLKVPVRVHLMQSSTEPALQTTLKVAEASHIFLGVNKIWAQSGVQFELESIVITRALDNAPASKDPKDRWVVKTLSPLSRTSSAIDVCYVKTVAANGFYSGGVVVVKDAPVLKSVPGGTDEPLARVTSHELGHALGLSHRQDSTNLMASKTTGFSLNENEIALARAGAMKRNLDDASAETRSH
jgi:hypothetical protein